MPSLGGDKGREGGLQIVHGRIRGATSSGGGLGKGGGAGTSDDNLRAIGGSGCGVIVRSGVTGGRVDVEVSRRGGAEQARRAIPGANVSDVGGVRAEHPEHRFPIRVGGSFVRNLNTKNLGSKKVKFRKGPKTKHTTYVNR